MSGSSEILVIHTYNQICEQSVATKRKFDIECLLSLQLPFGLVVVFFCGYKFVRVGNCSAGIFMTLK